MGLTIFLLNLAQLKTLTDFTRAIYSVSAFEEEHSLSIHLCLYLYSAFMEIYIQASTSSYFECYTYNTFLMKCLLLQWALLPNFLFPFQFLLKAGILSPPTFVLYYLPTNFGVDINIYHHH